MNTPGQRVRLEIIELAPHSKHILETGPREHVLVVLGGRCDMDFGSGGTFHGLGERPDVHSGTATAAFAPIRTRAAIGAGAEGCSLALVSAQGWTERAPYVVRPSDVRVEQRGHGHYHREVHDIVSGQEPADQLLVGETFSAGGVWSSYPPHRHDRDDPPHEAGHEEVFLVRISPASGFAVFLRYPDDDVPERAEVLHDMDVVRVGKGFHSFVVAAEHRLYYLWALAGPKRELLFRTDRRHAWILGEPGQEDTR